jgi:hypothetical protein
VSRSRRSLVGWQTSLMERYFLFVDCARGRLNGQYSPGSICEFWESLDLSELQEVTVQARRGLKLRRARAIDRDHEEHRFYSWIGISGVREVRLQPYITEVARV